MNKNYLNLIIVSVALTACGAQEVKLEEGPALAALPETTQKVLRAEELEQKRRALTALINEPVEAVNPNERVRATSTGLIKGRAFTAASIAAAAPQNPSVIHFHEHTFIYASRFELLKDQSILTHGKNLTIVADTIKLEGLIDTSPISGEDAGVDGGNLTIYASKFMVGKEAKIILSASMNLGFRGFQNWGKNLARLESKTLAALRPDLFGIDLSMDPTTRLKEEMEIHVVRPLHGKTFAFEAPFESRRAWANAVVNTLSAYKPNAALPSRFDDIRSLDAVAGDLAEMNRTGNRLSQQNGRNYSDLEISIQMIRRGTSPLNENQTRAISAKLPPKIRRLSGPFDVEPLGSAGTFVLVVGQPLNQEILYTANPGLASSQEPYVIMQQDPPMNIELYWEDETTSQISWLHKSSGQKHQASGFSRLARTQDVRIFSDSQEVDAYAKATVASERHQVAIKTTDLILKAWSAGFEDRWTDLYERIKSENLPGFDEKIAPFNRFKALAEAQRELESLN